MNSAPHWKRRLFRLTKTLAAPDRDSDFQSGHFDEENIIAHVRMKDRTGPNGE